MSFSARDAVQIFAFATPIFTGLCTASVVWRFAKNIRKAKPIKKDAIYEDEDGKATEESMASYSAKRSFIVIFLGVAFGLAGALTNLVNVIIFLFEYHYPDYNLVLCGCWVRRKLTTAAQC